MTVATATDLFAYTAWADAAALRAAAVLGPGAWMQPLGGSFPSLQAVLAHTAGGERVWLDRWTNRAPFTFPPFTVAPSPDDLRDVWQAVGRERDTWLATLTDAALATPYPYALFSGEASAEPLGEQVTHLTNHSTAHRGRAVAMLRAMDAVPPPTDFIRWARVGRSSTTPRDA